MTSLAEIVSGLRAEPLWATSSAARELFHSDMVQWLADNEPEAFAYVFDLDAAGEYECHRERGHLDLWIEAHHGGTSIVIENKLFSLPREDQLDQYSRQIAARPAMADCEQRLLSLTEPNWIDGRYGDWSWMSYRAFGQRLVECFQGRSDFAGQFAWHWGQLCLLLHDIARSVAIANESEPYELDSERARILDTRLLAFAATLRAYQLADRIRMVLNDPRAEVAASFTHSKALVEAFSRVRPGLELGWQCQEGQWRLAARTGENSTYEGRPCWGRSAAHAEDRTSWVQTVFPDHFRFEELGEVGIDSQLAKTERLFQHFAPNFTYQYRKVGAASVGQLVAAGAATSRRILRSAAPSADDGRGR